MKQIFLLSLCYLFQLQIACSQNQNPKILLVQSFLAGKVSMYNTETGEVIGDLPMEINKATFKVTEVTFKADNMFDLNVRLPLKDVVELNILPVSKASVSSAQFLPFNKLKGISLRIYDLFMIPKSSPKDLAQLKVNFIPLVNSIQPSTPIGIDNQGTIYKTTSKEMSYDPIFGTGKNLRRELCNILVANNVIIMNCEGTSSSVDGVSAKQRLYTSVKPTILDFTFNMCFSRKLENIVKYGFYNLKMKYTYFYSSGDSESVEVVNYGFYNAFDAHQLFIKALYDNACIAASNDTIRKRIEQSNELFANQYGQYRIKVYPKKSDAVDLKTIIKNSKEAVVTIEGSDNSFGSGFFISDSGYIITNYHVIEGAIDLRVKVGQDTATYIAELLRFDEYHDLALLKINITKNPFLHLKQQNQYEVGESVIAIGTPALKDLGQTVSKGIISGNRVIDRRNLIQTDVSINPGNSGGPLLNEDGEVVGVVVMKISGRGYEGLGFAIPSVVAIELLNIDYLK